MATSHGSIASFRIESPLPWGVRFSFSGTNLIQVTLTEECGLFEVVTDDAGNSGTECIALATRWLSSYIAGKTFPLPYLLNVSSFTSLIMAEVFTISIGDTLSYKEVAARAATSARPVGMACSRNPIPLVIPCHRVIASNGSIGGFIYGTALKEKMLSYEKMLVSKK